MISSFSSSSSSTSSTRSSSNNDDYWIWITLVPLGVTSVVSICSNAMSCYNFFIAWNMISQMHRRDLELLQNIPPCRKVEIERAVETISYAEKKKLVANSTTSSSTSSLSTTIPLSSSCSICLSGFEEDDEVSTPKKEGCDHTFHKDCLQVWLQKHPSCPYCRTEVLPPLPPPRSQQPVLRSSSAFVGWY